MNTEVFRKVCGQFATGITVITTTHQEKPYGFTANSFTSVSLEPPMVLFCLKTASETNKAFQASKQFAINILSEDQEAISNAFASSKNSQEVRFDKVELVAHTVPLIQGCLGYLVCDIMKYEEVGDHMVYYGQVAEGKHFDGNPLLYAKGGYQRLG